MTGDDVPPRESLALFLTTTEMGQKLLDDIMPLWIMEHGKAMEDELRREVDRRISGRASALIVCDGTWLEGYSAETTIHFENLLAGDDGTMTDREEYLRRTIPWRYRHLLALRPTLHLIESRSAEDEIERRWNVEMIRGIQGVGK
jgi:hypothetical protein